MRAMEKLLTPITIRLKEITPVITNKTKTINTN
jgi:hypothetical protein